MDEDQFFDGFEGIFFERLETLPRRPLNQWQTQKGEVLNISEMEFSHIQNCRAMISRELNKLDDRIRAIGAALQHNPLDLTKHQTELMRVADKMKVLEGYSLTFKKEVETRDQRDAERLETRSFQVLSPPENGVEKKDEEDFFADV